VLSSPQWHPGVIGIVASRVAERYHRPVLLLSRDGERLKGSGRSIPEFDLFQGLVDCGGILLGYGGHPQAAGLSLSEDRLDDLRQAFAAAVRSQLGDSLPEPSLQLEARLGLESVDMQLIKEIDLLQPFGPGNPQPLFGSNPLAVKRHKVFGGKHVSLEVRDESAGKTMLGKAWRQAESLGSEIAGKNVRLAFSPRLNTYNGLISIDLHIRDWEICS
jgi:single-stranded-DNA-specific exonuclease